MKKLTKLVSVVLALVMVMALMPVMNVMASTTPLIINFENNSYDASTSPLTATWSSSAISQVVADPLSSGRGQVLKFGSTGSTLSLGLNVASYFGNPEKNGVLTYKFDIYTPNDSTGVDVGLKVATTGDGTDGTTITTMSKGGSYSYVTDGEPSTWKYNYEQMPVNAWRSMTLIFDYVNGKYTIKSGTHEGYTASITDDKIAGSKQITNPFFIAFRCGATANTSFLYLDNVEVSYEVPGATDPDPDPEPEPEPDPVVPTTPGIDIDFENNSYNEATSVLTNTWDGSAVNEVVDDPVQGGTRGKVLKFGSTSSTASLDLNVGAYFGNPNKNGVLTYKFDIYNTAVDVAFKVSKGASATDGDTLTTIGKGGSYYYNKEDNSTAWEYNDMPTSDWRSMTLIFDYVNDTFTIKSGTHEGHTTPIVSDKVGAKDISNPFSVAFRAGVTANTTFFYLDNIEVTYAVPAPATPVFEVGTPAITGVSTLAAFRDAASLTVASNVKNTMGTSKDITYIVGIYNGSVLVDCAIAEASAADGTDGAASATISDVSFKTGKTYDNVKIFAWDSLTGLKPLATVVGTITE